MAYRIGEDSVLRGGYGITVSPLPLSRPLRGFYPLTINQTFRGPNGFVPFGTLAQGIPLFGGPDLSTGAVDLPSTRRRGHRRTETTSTAATSSPGTSPTSAGCPATSRWPRATWAP